MGLKLFWRFSSDAGTFTASTSATDRSVKNLKLNTLAGLWQDDGTELAPSIIVDLGSALAISAFALLNTDATDILVEAADDAGISVNVVVIATTASGADGDTNRDYYSYYTEITKRYVRVTFNGKSLASETRKAGRLVIGDHYELERSSTDGFAVGVAQDTSKKVRTEGGQTYSDIGVALRALRGRIPAMGWTDRDEVEALKTSYQSAVPFIASIDWDNYPIRQTLYGTLTDQSAITNLGFTQGAWSVSMLEQK